jgi:flagellar biosynthesis/type III secretory pathway chaperone
MNPPSPFPPNPEDFLTREISLYRELLEILEQESLALAEAREEDLFKLAAAKEAILGKLLDISRVRPESFENGAREAAREPLERLKKRVNTINLRNRETVALSLEVIADFLGFFKPPGAGTYQPAGGKELIGPASFCRRA